MYRVQMPTERSSLWSGTSGTSASCPVAAGMFSNINAARLAAGKGSIGWIHPAMYMHSSRFVNDVTKGNNKDGPTCSEGFYATPGWDPTTGLGSINYGKFEAVMLSLGNVNAALSYPSMNPASNLVQPPTSFPIFSPSASPISSPTNVPSEKPFAAPTEKPTARPISNPTSLPSVIPTVAPTENPTTRPSVNPTVPSKVRKPTRRPKPTRKRPSRSPLVVEFVSGTDTAGPTKVPIAQSSSFSPVVSSPELSPSSTSLTPPSPLPETPSLGVIAPSSLFLSKTSNSSAAHVINVPTKGLGTVTLLLIDYT